MRGRCYLPLERYRPGDLARFAAEGAHLTLVHLLTHDGSFVDEPDDVASRLLFAAPDDAGFVNGVVLEVEDGRMAKL